MCERCCNRRGNDVLYTELYTIHYTMEPLIRSSVDPQLHYSNKINLSFDISYSVIELK